ncbi:MAG TPA: hypothetical protein VMV92_09890 [Streptosporangiaceae bacterium]|nr:hypothetical protein [Streptosporangiaceae bacterium]
MDNAAQEDTELLAAIGRMVVNAAQLECSVAELVAIADGLRGRKYQDRATRIRQNLDHGLVRRLMALPVPTGAHAAVPAEMTALCRGRRARMVIRPIPRAKSRAESVLTPGRTTCHLPAETARWSTITQIYEGTNQIQRVVMARQLLK